MMDLYGNGLLLGEKTLDSLWMRQNLTMNNIANVDTPGFKSQYMTFENELAQKIRSALTVKKTSMKNVARGIENMRPSVHTTLNESTRLDENNVDMDQEQVHDKRMNDCLPPILFSAIFKLLKVLPDTELDAC